MYQFLLALIVALGGSTYYLWNENQTLKGNNAKLEYAVETQQETITNLQNDFALQGKSLIDMQSKNQQIEAEMNRYLDIFKRHDLTKLAAAKPGLIEPRVNEATKEVFNGIEQDSRDIDNADDGIELQSTPN
jgi:hypothetical protein|tara:strand:+ start:45 stop:440 length:396 start_codon:yes stop_codon:yes gene_type:complete